MYYFSCVQVYVGILAITYCGSPLIQGGGTGTLNCTVLLPIPTVFVCPYLVFVSLILYTRGPVLSLFLNFFCPLLSLSCWLSLCASASLVVVCAAEDRAVAGAVAGECNPRAGGKQGISVAIAMALFECCLLWYCFPRHGGGGEFSLTCRVDGKL